MPTYRYRCGKCGEDLEIWQSFAEKPKARHAGGCGGKLTKVLQPAGIVLKGSGFYKTDSRKTADTAAGRDGAGSGTSDGHTNGSSSTSSGSSSTSTPASATAS